ncbi:protein kinase domain-containing protein [Sorangium sp. So ce1000]|uniref:serine/threonine-protein kinase n=1 Tax=Sorangium sp. So ce1000 TaxID=3133325 RepID=UPI003F6254B6
MKVPVVEGDVIAGKYRVDRVLGRGGMGIVVAASHLLLPQRVAIKLLLSDESPALLARFLREARAVVRLKGEHVVRVFDVGELGSGVPYIVMEYLEGEDLSDVVRESGTLGVVDAADYVLQACVAMAEAHAAGIVHRDLKPANLFLTTTPGGAKLIKVLDFGISKEAPGSIEGGGASLTQTREMLGSPIYMSPEQMRSSRSVDARSDVWALGAVLYRLLVGQPPFEAPALAELVLQVASAEPIPPTALRSEIPLGLEAVILRCLEKDPARRPQTVADLARALAPFAHAGAQELAERAARILGAGAPLASPSAGSVPAPRPAMGSGPPSAPSGAAMTTLLPTTRGLARTPAQPASRRILGVALGAVVIAALALVIWGAVALPGRASEQAALQAAEAASRDDAPSRRARQDQDTAERRADPPIAPELQSANRDALPPQQLSASPVVVPATAAPPPRPAQQGRRAPSTMSAPAPPTTSASPGGTNPLDMPIK